MPDVGEDRFGQAWAGAFALPYPGRLTTLDITVVPLSHFVLLHMPYLTEYAAKWSLFLASDWT